MMGEDMITVLQVILGMLDEIIEQLDRFDQRHDHSDQMYVVNEVILLNRKANNLAIIGSPN